MAELIGIEPYSWTQISAIFDKYRTQTLQFRCHEFNYQAFNFHQKNPLNPNM